MKLRHTASVTVLCLGLSATLAKAQTPYAMTQPPLRTAPMVIPPMAPAPNYNQFPRGTDWSPMPQQTFAAQQPGYGGQPGTGGPQPGGYGGQPGNGVPQPGYAPVQPPVYPVQPDYRPPQALAPNYQPDPGAPPADGCAPYDCCGSPTIYFWVRDEALLWKFKDQGLPALVTTSTTQASVGRIGFPDTSVVFGGRVASDPRAGFRTTIGGELTAFDMGDGRCFPLGVEASFLWLARQDNSFQQLSAGDPVLARPFVDALTGQSRVEQVANLRITDPAGNLLVRGVAGKISIHTPSDLLGGELNTVFVAVEDQTVHTNFLVGGRYLRLHEALNIREDLTQLADPAAGIPQTAFVVQDRFATNNDFYGGQLGLRTLLRLGLVSLELQGKAALGVTSQSVRIDGATASSVTGGPTTVGPGGLLALPTNMGHYQRDRFTVVPEGTANLGYQFTPNARAFIGYNFLYWSSVVRPGPQVDLVVNPNFLPPQLPPLTAPARPAFLGAASSMWVQGMNFGLEFTY